jgi:hypothetical protein
VSRMRTGPNFIREKGLGSVRASERKPSVGAPAITAEFSQNGPYNPDVGSPKGGGWALHDRQPISRARELLVVATNERMLRIFENC